MADGECSANFCKTGDLRQKMLNMFEHEFSEDNHADCDVFSVDNSRFLKMMDDSVIKTGGHDQLPLSWKNEDISLPNNRSVVEKRLQSLKRRFERDDYFDQYREKIDWLLREG